MKVSRPKTEKWHNYEEGDCGKPIDRDGSNKAYFKKGCTLLCAGRFISTKFNLKPK